MACYDDATDDMHEFMRSQPTSKLIAAIAATAAAGEHMILLSFWSQADFDEIQAGPADFYKQTVSRFREAIADEIDRRMPPRAA